VSGIVGGTVVVTTVTGIVAGSRIVSGIVGGTVVVTTVTGIVAGSRIVSGIVGGTVVVTTVTGTAVGSRIVSGLVGGTVAVTTVTGTAVGSRTAIAVGSVPEDATAMSVPASVVRAVTTRGAAASVDGTSADRAGPPGKVAGSGTTAPGATAAATIGDAVTVTVSGNRSSGCRSPRM
jgi:hypothetical protein